MNVLFGNSHAELAMVLSMKKFLVLLAVSGLSSVNALPFQEPVAGSYQCFASSDPFDPNAQDANATLEISADKSYIFTTASASETGTFTTYEMAESGSEDQEIAFAQAFQSGTIVALQPADTTLLYGGLFVMDETSQYMLMKNNNNVWIRCQSEGADVAATMETILSVGNSEETVDPDTTSATDYTTDTLTDNLVYNSLNSQINNMTSLGIPTLAPCYSCGY